MIKQYFWSKKFWSEKNVVGFFFGQIFEILKILKFWNFRIFEIFEIFKILKFWNFQNFEIFEIFKILTDFFRSIFYNPIGY